LASVDLNEVQRLVVDAVMRPAPLTARDAHAAVGFVRPSVRGMTPASRLEVYRDQFWLRHVASLAEDFPTVRWTLGEPSFDALLRAYLRARPPRGWNLQRLGAGVPSFLATHTPWNEDPLAHDAALLDWAFMEVFDAPDAAPLDLSVLAAAPPDAWPRARISFVPALRHVATRHPVHELREAVKRDEGPARPEPSPTRAVVWRDAACFLHVASVEAPAARLMEALQAGQTLGDACASVAAAHPEMSAEAFDADVGRWFQQWTASGWLSAVAL
jgi:hypothetical protein